MAVKSISELDSQVTANESDLFEVAVVDGGSASGYSSKKESAAAIAEGIVNQYTYPLGMPNMQAKTILGAINQLLANVAAVYDSTQTYAVGAFVTYNGQLYKCNTAIDTAETFDPTKWDAVNLADNLGSGGSGMHNYSTEEQVVGTWIDGSTLYERTFALTNIVLSGTITLFTAADCASMDIQAVINISEGYFEYYYDGNKRGSLPYGIGGSNGVSIWWDSNDGIRMLRNGSTLSINELYFTIRYTKTT